MNLRVRLFHRKSYWDLTTASRGAFESNPFSLESVGDALKSALETVTTLTVTTYTNTSLAQGRTGAVLRAQTTLVHWAAVDAQNKLRIDILQGLASVLRISTDLLTGGIARNPVGAVRTGQALLENVRIVWSLLQPQ
jgi:hypothetical protein